MSQPTMSNEEFRERIKAIVGPALKADKPCVRKPTDRGYYPPAMMAEATKRAIAKGRPLDQSELRAEVDHALSGEKTIWNSDGTDGPCLICQPPKEAA